MVIVSWAVTIFMTCLRWNKERLSHAPLQTACQTGTTVTRRRENGREKRRRQPVARGNYGHPKNLKDLTFGMESDPLKEETLPMHLQRCHFIFYQSEDHRETLACSNRTGFISFTFVIYGLNNWNIWLKFERMLVFLLKYSSDTFLLTVHLTNCISSSVLRCEECDPLAPIYSFLEEFP